MFDGRNFWWGGVVNQLQFVKSTINSLRLFISRVLLQRHSRFLPTNSDVYVIHLHMACFEKKSVTRLQLVRNNYVVSLHDHYNLSVIFALFRQLLLNLCFNFEHPYSLSISLTKVLNYFRHSWGPSSKDLSCLLPL